MEAFYDLAVFIHVISAVVLVMSMTIMQLVVGKAIGKVPPEFAPDARSVIQTRWHPVVDGAIVLLTLTAVFLLVARAKMIGVTPILHIKVTAGIITLLLANMLHFYFRGLKRKLKARGETERLAGINRYTGRMERTALVLGAFTFLCGLWYNHPPF